MLLCRITGGSRRRVWSRATFSEAIASKAVLALEIALESYSPRSATVVESLLELTMKRDSSRWSAFSSPAKAPVRFSAGPKYLIGFVGGLGLAGVERRVALDEVGEALPHRRREGVEELVDVDRGRGRGEAELGAVVERRVAVRPGADRDVVVGDAGERGGADHRGRALVQLLFDLDVDLGEVVVGELDAFDRADRGAADQDLVVGHELAGVLEDERVLVAAVAAEEDEGEHDHRDCEGRDDGDPARG